MTTVFSTTLSWDRPLDQNRPYHHTMTPLDPQMIDPLVPSYLWGQHHPYPEQGTITLSIFPHMLGTTPDEAPALITALLAEMGGHTEVGIPTFQQRLAAVRGPHNSATKSTDPAWIKARQRVGSDTLLVLSHYGAGPADGHLQIAGDRLIGTGAMAGSWDLAGFFAPQMSLQKRPLAREQSIFSIGAVAMALGAIRAWMESLPAQPMTLTTTPYPALAAATTAIISQALDTHGLLGTGTMTPLREDLLKRGHGPIARAFQARTRCATKAGRDALAEDLCQSLLDILAINMAWAPTPLPCPTHWRAHTITLIAEACAKNGTDTPYEHGYTLGRAVGPDASAAAIAQHARALNLW